MTRLCSSFHPAPPPGTNGTPIFPDIDFLVASDPHSEGNRRKADPNAVFVVTGASRGIGLQFVKNLVENYQGTVVACCRSPSSATELNKYRTSLDNSQRIELAPLDLEDQNSIENMGGIIRERYNRVDMLLNVAGLLGDSKTTPGPERSVSKIDRDWLEKTLAVNLIGPVMLCKELSPFLVQSRRRPQRETELDSNDRQDARPSSVVANLSARVGSISDNTLGGWYSYRMSKAALNQATRTLALEWKRQNAWCVSLHPGTTNTDLSKPFQANVKEGSIFPVDFTVSQLLQVIESLNEQHSGGFYDWAGQSISF